MAIDLARSWWMVALRGVLGILFGLIALVWPRITLLALVALFGAYALVDGEDAVAAGIASHGENRRWWAELLVGVAGIVLGVLTFAWSDVTALALHYLVVSWAIVTGVFEVVATVELGKVFENEWRLGIGGVASVLFGLPLIVRPGAGALGLLWLIGATPSSSAPS